MKFVDKGLRNALKSSFLTDIGDESHL